MHSQIANSQHWSRVVKEDSLRNLPVGRVSQVFLCYQQIHPKLANSQHSCWVVKAGYLEQLTCTKVLTKGFFVINRCTCNFTTFLLGEKTPVKCKILGTVFATECTGETTIKNKVKQNKGILKFSAHNKTVNYANALVAYLLKQMASLCVEPFPSHVPAVRIRDATLVLAS